MQSSVLAAQKSGADYHVISPAPMMLNRVLSQALQARENIQNLPGRAKDNIQNLQVNIQAQGANGKHHLIHFGKKIGILQDLEHMPDGTSQVENVRLVDKFGGRKANVGTLYLTATHLIFVDSEGRKETWISHMHIGSVEKQSLTTSGSPLQIRCKNFLNVTFIIPKERDCHDVYTSLLKLSQPVDLTDLYAFHYTASDIPDKHGGWDFFDLQSEYMRMGAPNENWVLSNINKDYEMCDTYPRYLYVPSAASTPIILGSARFRSRGRLPVLSYLHRSNQAAICRCSQPLAGFSARCMEDESMLQAIRKANITSKFMYVVDTRPKINAMANKAAGKGYENENFYANIKFQFIGVENVHVMRNSQQKLVEVCELKNPSMSSFLSGLESSGHMKHIKAILDTAVFTAKAVVQGTSVIVHCSDGWDRTAQTCALASLMLDPYYRTIDGFQTLIEKEWLSFGHKFTDRCGFISTVDSKENSPVFTQFIDCVWQMTQQFPTAFQFNERYLLTLHDHVYSCQFGTFIGNCEKDRVDLRLCDRTFSLWAYLGKYTTDFSNPFYKKVLEVTHPTLIPDTFPQSIRFWRGLYCRFESGVHPRENILDIVCTLKDHSRSLEDHYTLLEKRVASLYKLLGHNEATLNRALNMLSSSESMDFRALLMSDSGIKSPQNDTDRKRLSNDVNHLQPDANANNAPRESDSESGFEDNGSQMTRSYQDGISESGSTDNLQVEQVLMELQSIAVDWKSLRNVKNCSCALPFEQYTKKVENVRLVDKFGGRKANVGTLYLTATHLIFVDSEGRKETWISHMHIGSVEKQSLTTSGSPLQIRCKNFLNVTFIIPKERDCHDVYTSLLKLSQPVDLTDLYAFHYTASDIPDKHGGWDFFDLQSEYMRMGAPNENWVLSNINKDYEAAICRCSQPLAGFSARCMEDESMLQAIRKANITSKFMYVVDTRPKINAMANKAAGKGYENENFYANIKFQFIGVENVHVMRNSQQKLVEVCELKNPSMSSFLSGLESSGHMKHIKAILDTAVFTAKAVVQGTSVIVHCSDGWDRTAQTCALASLMLDPYYRTIDGFQTLIQKEWLSFGHKFTDRCGFISTVDSKENSPVFTQFIDCVWQMTQQFPTAFQFNERYLLTLHDHVYSCQLGTFIGNCEKDRVDLRLCDRTFSLWAYLGKYTTDFSNPFYKKVLELTHPTLIPDTFPQSIRFWRGLYCRFESGVHPRENILDIVCTLKDHSRSLEDHYTLLEKRVASLYKLLGHNEATLNRALNMLSSSESMDFRALLMSDSGIKSPQNDTDRKRLSNDVNHLQPDANANNAPRESDSESGFEDNGSQMTRSYQDGISESGSTDNLQVEQVLMELQSIAVDWKSLRNVKNCSCALPFEQYTKKHHCWRCGNIYCTRCIDRYMPLAGHESKQPVPICKACFKDIKHSPSPSIDDFQKLQKQLNQQSLS